MQLNEQQKRYGAYALAIVALISGGVLLFLGSGTFTIRSLGIGALLLSVYLVRLSNVHWSPGPRVAAGEGATNRPRGLMGLIGVASIPATALAYLLLYEDSRHGGRQVWPVYLFGAVALACVGVWSALAAKLFQ